MSQVSSIETINQILDESGLLSSENTESLSERFHSGQLDGLQSVLATFNYNDKQVIRFIELLDFTKCLDSQVLTDENEASSWLRNTLKTSWLRKVGSERWDLNDTEVFTSNYQQLISLFDDLGLISEVKPNGEHYDHILVLGASIYRAKSRLVFLAELWEQGTRFETISLLGGQRPLTKGMEDSYIQLIGEGATEMAMMEVIYSDLKQTWPPELQNIEAISINTKLKQGTDEIVHRPNTRDTAQDWKALNLKPGKVLVISDQPYVTYQHSVVRSVLPNKYDIETIGRKAYFRENISTILDCIAKQVLIG